MLFIFKNAALRPDVVASTWLTPSDSEAESGRITVGGQPGQKVSGTLSQQVSWAVLVHISNPTYVGGTGKRIALITWPRKNTRPYLKNNQSKRGLDVANVESDCLASAKP
jgi:hypothetical protein